MGRSVQFRYAFRMALGQVLDQVDRMHELSIANSIVEIAREHADRAGAEKIESLTLRIGALSCVQKDSLLFSFEVVSKETPLEGAELRIIDVPVVIFCANCQREVELGGIQQFRCTICQQPSADIRRGTELEIDSIEIMVSTSATK